MTVEDVTLQRGILNLQGPSSRLLLFRLVPDLPGLGFSRSLAATIAGVPVLVVRITYVGELGYELHVPRAGCERVLAAVIGVRDVPFAGMEAMESLCLEKGYRHWPADIQAIDNPLEASMGFVCKLRTDEEFCGRAALEEARDRGLAKRLVCLTMDRTVPLNGGETILMDGVVRGYLRRASTGAW